MNLKDNTHQISLDEAIILTANYRINFNNEFDPTKNQAKGFYYTKEAFDDLFAQEGAVGVRIYGGQVGTADGTIKNSNLAFVMVAVDINGNDILTPGAEVVKERGQPCPNYCGTENSPLANNQ